MSRRRRFFVISGGAVLGLALLACDRSAPTPTVRSSPGPAPSAAAPASSRALPAASLARASGTASVHRPLDAGTLRSARLNMERWLADGADPAALTAELAPRPGDAAEVLGDALAARAARHYPRVFEQLVIAPDPTQTELLLWRATTEELQNGTGDAAKCPARYRERASELKTGTVWYCFRFVVPGEKVGTESEGLTFVRGRWALFPAPWAIE